MKYLDFTLLICVCECMRMRLPLFSPSVIKFVVSCKLARVGLLLLLDPWPPATKMCTIHVYARIFQNYQNHARNYRQSKNLGSGSAVHVETAYLRPSLCFAWKINFFSQMLFETPSEIG